MYINNRDSGIVDDITRERERKYSGCYFYGCRGVVHADSYCHDLADHFVENAFLLKTLQIYAKFNYGS